MEPNTMNQGVNPQPKEGGAGPVIGGIIILAIIVVGGLYFWSARSGEEVTPDTDEIVEEITEQSDSDATADITADLEATDVDELDAELE